MIRNGRNEGFARTMCSYVQQTDYRRLPDPFGTQHRRWEIIEICIIEEQTKREILEVGPMGWEIEERTDEGERKLFHGFRWLYRLAEPRSQTKVNRVQPV